MRAREPASLAGKRGSLRHSTTSFSENVDVTEKSYVNYQVLGNFIILRPGEGLKNRANFSGEKNTISFLGCPFFENTRKNFKLNLVLESKGLNLSAVKCTETEIHTE